MSLFEKEKKKKEGLKLVEEDNNSIVFSSLNSRYRVFDLTPFPSLPHLMLCSASTSDHYSSHPPQKMAHHHLHP